MGAQLFYRVSLSRVSLRFLPSSVEIFQALCGYINVFLIFLYIFLTTREMEKHNVKNTDTVRAW